jgi:cytosine/adenosine deaminase-related metal-dependent hydrolase
MKILTGAFVFTCNDTNDIGFFNIAIRSNLITGLSRDLEPLKRKYPEAEIIEEKGKIIIPTFFNAHFHPEAIVCREFEPRMPITQWRNRSLLEVENSLDNQNEAFYEKMYHLAFFSALQFGVNGMAFEVRGGETGARGMYSAAKLSGTDVVGFAESEEQVSFLRKVADTHMKAGLAIPYQRELTLFGLSAIARGNLDPSGWIMAHVDESEEDVFTTKTNFNLNLIQLLKKSNLLGRATILVGLNGTDLGFLDLARVAGANVVIVPTKLEVKSFDLIQGVFDKFAIGSDWESPGLFHQIKQLVEFGVEPWKALACAVRTSAELFNFGSKVGSIEVGKVANFAFVDANKFATRQVERFAPADSIRVLIEDYDDSDISDVMIEGEFVYKNRKLLLYHDDELIRERSVLIDMIKSGIENPNRNSAGYVSGNSTADRNKEKIRPGTIRVETDNTISGRQNDVKKSEPTKDIHKIFGEDEF